MKTAPINSSATILSALVMELDIKASKINSNQTEWSRPKEIKFSTSLVIGIWLQMSQKNIRSISRKTANLPDSAATFEIA
jgi:hypothetical protein